MRVKGYFAIGVYHPKTEHNIGTLWRSAYQLGAAEIFAIAPRWPKRQASDTTKTWRSIPFRIFPTVQDLIDHLPYSCSLVGVEMGGTPLPGVAHPTRCAYLLGAEDHGIPPEVQRLCHKLISIPSVRVESYNVAVAGAVVMWDRLAKQQGHR